MIKLIFKTCIIDIDKLDGHGNNLLIWSSYSGDIEIVKYALKMKADVNVLDNENRNPLYLAKRECHYNIVKILIKYEAVK